jgi:hypothetical protein
MKNKSTIDFTKISFVKSVAVEKHNEFHLPINEFFDSLKKRMGREVFKPEESKNVFLRCMDEYLEYKVNTEEITRTFKQSLVNLFKEIFVIR